MIRQLFNDLTPEELAAATPDPARLVSFGEVTRWDEVWTASGRKMEPVTFELFCERQGSGFTTRVWHRYKSNPSALIPQFSLEKRDTTQPAEYWSDDELAAHRASLPPQPTSPPDSTIYVCPPPSF